MKVLHIMWDEKFKKGVVEFYNTFFNNGEHEICYLNKPGCASLIEQECTIPQKELLDTKTLADTSKFISECKKYDYIVIHSYRIGVLPTLILLLNGKLRKKLVWIAWGFDLYVNKPKLSDLRGQIRLWTSELMKAHIPHFVGIFPPDCDYFKSKYPKSKANIYHAPYCSARISPEFFNYSEKSRLEKTREDNDTIYIQIGHCAQKQLNHIAALKMLERWKDKDIKLFIPLSYGNTEYADQVQEYAERMFPGKTVILRQMMPAEDYFELTKRIDIAIFNTPRQCGLSNIMRLAFRNVKIYMLEECVMYNCLKESGIPIQSCQQLCEQRFEEFITPAAVKEKEKFAEFLSYLSDINYQADLWIKIYDCLRGLLEND